ncbi:MAG TPA: hypothetical protein VFY87_24740 [Geminicoccaceae bacterium]|nr:hypothetical protein [Geminicoccaceae bacterium]
MNPLQALVAKLLVTAKVLAGYPVPAVPPAVSFAPDGELAALACNGCQAHGLVNGLFLPERGIILSGRLDPGHDVRARAVLLHEIVHYLQELNGRFADRPACERYFLREREAYAVENRYLARHQEPPNQGWLILVQGGGVLTCGGGSR